MSDEHPGWLALKARLLQAEADLAAAIRERDEAPAREEAEHDILTLTLKSTEENRGIVIDALHRADDLGGDGKAAAVLSALRYRAQRLRVPAALPPAAEAPAPTSAGLPAPPAGEDP